MGYAKSSFVHNFCMPNAIFTFKEYLLDYASEDTKAVGENLIKEYVLRFKGDKVYNVINGYLKRLEEGERDLHI